MTRLLKRLLAAALVGTVIGASAAAVSIAEKKQQALRVTQADKARLVNVGNTAVIYHFTQRRSAFELNVTILTKDDVDDVLQTRMQMRDGQILRMVLNEDHEDIAVQADRITFRRDGDSLLVQAQSATRDVAYATAKWPFE